MCAHLFDNGFTMLILIILTFLAESHRGVSVQALAGRIHFQRQSSATLGGSI
jgi:hypothetical protein